MNAEPCELLPWDTEFFGFPIARLIGKSLTPDEWPRIRDWCDARGIHCLYGMLLPDFQSTRVVEAAAANLVDVKMTYAWSPTGKTPPPIVPRVRRAVEADLPALQRIAGESHRGRFHHDGRFPPEKCDELYRVWIRKGLLERKDHVLIVEDDGAACGYCACGTKPDPGGSTEKIGVIEIVAVDERHRGRGIGGDLVDAALAWFVQQGMSSVHLVTQAQNLAAQRLYQRCGFVSIGCEFVYHKWFERGSARG